VKIFISVFLIIFISNAVSAQQRSIIRGKVIDAKTKLPLSHATVKVSNQDIELSAGSDGGFEIQVTSQPADSLEVSHVGYKTLKKSIGDLSSPITISLEDYSLQLRTITITSRKLNLKQVDNSLRVIKDSLFVYETETTVGLYNLFLTYLEENGQTELLEICDYDLSAYDEATREFYKSYTAPYVEPINKNDTTVKNYTDYPVVNIRYEAAILFCQWFTEHYNNATGKKKFTKVRFRLPTLNEWQIAALGYKKFQSWNLDENIVEAVVPPDTVTEFGRGKKTTIPVKDGILYPWWMAHNYRKKAQNARNCFLGNFKIIETSKPCQVSKVAYDGWAMMSPTAAYFPNGMGLYDVVGNVAEMINEKGKACGGSWNDPPNESTLRSVKGYTKPDETIGFRLFMEVIE
jgi:formylglycine-generating enzyme required for sulfatase activity